jgi:hypothetical protein
MRIESTPHLRSKFVLLFYDARSPPAPPPPPARALHLGHALVPPPSSGQHLGQAPHVRSKFVLLYDDRHQRVTHEQQAHPSGEQTRFSPAPSCPFLPRPSARPQLRLALQLHPFCPVFLPLCTRSHPTVTPLHTLRLRLSDLGKLHTPFTPLHSLLPVSIHTPPFTPLYSHLPIPIHTSLPQFTDAAAAAK